MGEIADGLINGDFDMYTGEYLGRGQGFPRTKQDLRKEKEKRKQHWKEYWNSLSTEEREVRLVYESIRGKQMGQVRMREIAHYLNRELGYTQLPKSIEQYKIIYSDIDKFKKYLKSINNN